MKVVDARAARQLRRLTDHEVRRAAALILQAKQASNGTGAGAAEVILHALVVLAKRTPSPVASLRDAISLLEGAIEANYGAAS